MKLRRFDMRAILRDPKQRRKLITEGVVATMAREGIDVTLERAEAIYDEQRATVQRRRARNR